MTTPPPTKRQKREQYRKAQAEAQNEAAEAAIKLPKKKFYRQRAHANPFSDHQLDYPISPAHMNWASHYPAYVDPDPSKTNLAGARQLLKDVEVVDIGCGFGGLLIGLAPVLPETLIVGMEIRTQVLEYVTTRIQVLRSQQHQLKAKASSPALAESPLPVEGQAPSPSDSSSSPSLVPGGYENISAIRSNTMKFFPNFFGRHQLSKIFICFPDPHFKARKHKARIISENLNAEYAYALRPGGLLYTITDVEEYHRWILRHFRSDESQGDAKLDQDDSNDETAQTGGIKDLWERVPDEELEKDECVQVMKEGTEESKKVTRNKGNKYVAVFRRKADPEWPVLMESSGLI